MKKGKICIIFTGGTIGSSCKDKTVNLNSGSSALLINMYKNAYNDGVQFDELYPINILSENIQVEDINSIVECIKNVDYSSYDGIILTHGTDTLVFTANYLSQVLANIPIPLVMVSALYPLEDERSNGLENFRSAVAMIEKTDIRGVFVAFKNPYDCCKIHLASRLLEACEINGKFKSLFDVYFAKVVDGEFLYNDNINNPTIEDVNNNVQPELKDITLCNDIMTIDAHSLINFARYRFGRHRPKALIVKLYHSGTICTTGNEENFLTFLKYCDKYSVPVVLAPVDSKANVYASVKGKMANVTFSYDMSYEMTIVKVMLAVGSNRPINKVLEENRFFEKV